MSGSLWPGICGWYINLQFASSCFMPFPAEIVKHVCDAACVSESVCDKSCRSPLDHFNLVFFFILIYFGIKDQQYMLHQGFWSPLRCAMESHWSM